MAGIYDSCAHCGAKMVHASGRGKARRYCSNACADAARLIRKASRVYETCRVEGCNANATRVGPVLCETHYCRLRRTGSTVKEVIQIAGRRPVPKASVIDGPLTHTGGYLLVYKPDHPLCRTSARVYQHRVVYYDEHGPGPFNCHWCGTLVTWEDMHVDHLDDDKKNNAVANLVASCARCNQQRGRWKIMRTHRDRTGVTVNGETLTLNEWAARMAISRETIVSRMKKGWSVERAVLTPRGPTGPKTRHQYGRGD